MTHEHNKNHDGGPTHTIEALTTTGAACIIHEYGHDPVARSFGEETVEKLGIDPTQAFKALMVRLEPTDEFVVGCVFVRTHLSMKLIARTAGAKSTAMVDPAVAQRRTDHVVGGISPFGQTIPHRVFIDSAYLDHETMIISGGRQGLSVELNSLDLVELTDAEVTDLA